MKPLSKHIQEGLNEESKSILDIAVRNDGKGLGLPESNSEETVVEEIKNDDAKNEDVVIEEATEKEKPSE